METIGGKIGKFIALEEGWEQKVDKRSAKILIEVDLCDGLYEEIHMEMHESLWQHKLNYWKILFRCFSCRKFGHLAKDCIITEQRTNQPSNKGKGISQNKRRCETQSKDGA